MSKVIAVLCVLTIMVAGPAWAQSITPNEAGVIMGQWHLNPSDVEATKKLFVTLGGVAAKAGDLEVVRFAGVDVYLHLGAGAQPPSGGSVGSVVNHVGFTVRNVQESSARWKAAGIAVEPGNNGRTDQAWIMTPDQLRLEILEDTNQSAPIQHHHLHYFVAESEVPKMQEWYGKVFGAKPGTRAGFPAADIPGANLTFSVARGETASAPTRGRVLDHVGFQVRNLDEFARKLEAAGIPVERPRARDPLTGGPVAFLTDPWGTYIEVTEIAARR